MYVLFPLLDHAYKFLNLFVPSEIVVASTWINSEMKILELGHCMT
jgi:hypothetical protein